MDTEEQSSVPLKSFSDENPVYDEVLLGLYAQPEAYSAAHGHDLKRI